MKNSVKVVRTTSENPHFSPLVALLDRDLWARYPELGSSYWDNNILAVNKNVVIIYRNDIAVGCGCFKKYDSSKIELKRMFVSNDARGMGYAKLIIKELEDWAQEIGFKAALLETLSKQFEAISLYQKVGYTIVDNYGPYVGIENSICMQKQL